MGVCALGIDVGLSGVRAAVLGGDGTLHGAARAPLPWPRLGPGLAEQEPSAWLEAALAAGAEAVAAAGVEIAAVGIGALGAAPVLCDASFRPLRPAMLFALDTRAEEERCSLSPGLSHDHALPKLLWLARHEPTVVERAAWVLDPTGWLVARLTGVATMDTIVARDYTFPGAASPVPLPEPVDPLALAGALTPEAAGVLGLRPGTPVAAGTYDTYVDVAGAGVRRPGDGCVLLGSTLIVALAVREPVACAGLELSPYPGEGVLLGGWTAAGGSTLAWFCGLVADGDLPAAAAALEPGSGGLLAAPYLAGERTPIHDPDARGVIVGLSLSATRAELYRAFVDAVALSARDHLERLLAAGLAPEVWRAGGGGVHDRAWAQATADALGAPLAVQPHAGAGAAPAQLALRAIGVEPELAPEHVVEPDPARHARFEHLYGAYRMLYPALAPTMHRLARRRGR